MTDDSRFYQLQTQIAALRETVDRQGRTIDALIASIPQMSQSAAPSGGRSNAAGKTYREWVSWLELHGPAYRKDIMDAVGKPLPGNQPVVDWTSIMATWPDDAVPSDTLCKINGRSTGQGRPPVIYFLWAQRYSLLDEFGVGPSLATMLGVIQPPIVNTGSSTIGRLPVGSNADSPGLPADEWVDPQPEVEPEPTEESERFATMDEWHARWDETFDVLARYGDKPSDWEKEQMIATMPEDTNGEPVGTVLARSLYEAKERNKS